MPIPHNFILIEYENNNTQKFVIRYKQKVKKYYKKTTNIGWKTMLQIVI